MGVVVVLATTPKQCRLQSQPSQFANAPNLCVVMIKQEGARVDGGRGVTGRVRDWLSRRLRVLLPV